MMVFVELMFWMFVKLKTNFSKAILTNACTVFVLLSKAFNKHVN
jgi:hypothetical protein